VRERGPNPEIMQQQLLKNKKANQPQAKVNWRVLHQATYTKREKSATMAFQCY